MTYPAVTTIPCTATFYDFANQTPATGYVAFEPSRGFTYTDADGIGTMLVPSTIRAALDGNGAISVDLPCPDDPNLDAVGVYTVTEHIVGGRPPYQIAASYSGGPIDLATVDKTPL